MPENQDKNIGPDGGEQKGVVSEVVVPLAQSMLGGAAGAVAASKLGGSQKPPPPPKDE